MTIIAEDGNERQHRQSLHKLLSTSTGMVRIASAYVTDTALLLSGKVQKIRLLTSLTRMDVVSNATSLGALRSLIESGVECRSLARGSRIHAKVYIFGGQTAVVTSANLTTSAFYSNIEVGVQVAGNNSKELIHWFDALWERATRVDLAEVSRLEQETEGLRREYAALRRKANNAPRRRVEATPCVGLPTKLRGLLGNAPRFFVCNTNRKNSTDVEAQMRLQKFAAVWEDFRYPNHIERVRTGDAIFMFAKGVGIVGIGRAAAACEVLGPHDSRRIRSSREYDGREWRVPVEGWLAWVEHDAEACPCVIPNASFVDVSGAKYDDLRRAIHERFLGGD